jgi:hypothetical protein
MHADIYSEKYLRHDQVRSCLSFEMTLLITIEIPAYYISIQEPLYQFVQTVDANPYKASKMDGTINAYR